MPTIASDQLEQFAAALLQAGGASAEEARITAVGLVDANLCGYDSHGVMRIPYYVAAVEKGDVKPHAPWEVLRESDHHLSVDAHWGFGHVAGLRLTEKLVEKAQAGGVGLGTMLKSGHIGRLGQYAEIVAARGLVSLLMVNSHGAVHRVAPPGGRASRLATNPLCIGVPNGDDDHLILDFSTSATAEGKVRVKWIAKEPAPEGWLIDALGRPTTDPATLYGEPRGAILPFGGPQMYKGFGLGLMVDILCGALSGGLVSREQPQTPIGNCVFMLVIDPAFFGGAQHFAAEVSQFAQFVRDCPRCEGVEEILLPGDPERRIRKLRATGIPLDDENWKKLTDLASKLGIAAGDFVV